MIKFNFKLLWKEEWKDTGINGQVTNRQYYISNYGRVAVLNHGKASLIKTPSQNKELAVSATEHHEEKKAILFKHLLINKYAAINVRLANSQTKIYYIHKLVAQHFLSKPLPNQMFVIHKDYNKGHNYVNNLAWASAKERGEHQKNNPYFMKVKSRPKYKKLDEGRKKLLIQKIMDPNRKTRYKILSKQFGISVSHLYRIKKENQKENPAETNPFLKK